MWEQIISTFILTFGIPFAVGLSIHWTRILAQKLPEQQRHALEQFAKIAVQSVEQEYLNDPGKADKPKKRLAEDAIIKLFSEFNLPVPSRESIGIVIEAAVLSLPKPQDLPPSRPSPDRGPPVEGK
jgi:hypothetical protein